MIIGIHHVEMAATIEGYAVRGRKRSRQRDAPLVQALQTHELPPCRIEERRPLAKHRADKTRGTPRYVTEAGILQRR